MGWQHFAGDRAVDGCVIPVAEKFVRVLPRRTVSPWIVQ
jgi:hypothetical protein